MKDGQLRYWTPETPNLYGLLLAMKEGSRKYLMASLDQSLRRMHLDYVDLFYSHRYDPDTPLEETLAEMALAWVLAQQGVTSVLVGASSVAQLDKNLKCVHAPSFEGLDL